MAYYALLLYHLKKKKITIICKYYFSNCGACASNYFILCPLVLIC